MELTGKCKEDFQLWIENQDMIYYNGSAESTVLMLYGDFIELPESMRWGVYLDFFDSAGIYIEITFDKVTEPELMKWWVDINQEAVELPDGDMEFDSRIEAMKVAIDFACGIYNSRQ